MFVKEVIIDGFKSYAHRTVISGWDPLFNAITGLNGSGKSNILDAICFVLGISNLSQVRAGNLQELVYKMGQAGVTKACVTIVFDNTDKAQSPVGYEQHDEITITRQVVIGGRNKYLLNGLNAQQSRITNLFHSVQLNVNNPHFLIMQGRITKVLNMKPPEILSMIEEAAGTRMFETKKNAAIRTMLKKDAKIGEINEVLENEITPTLAKLRKERSSFLEFQKMTTETEHLSRYCTAYDFAQGEATLQQSTAELEGIDNVVSEHKVTIRTSEKDIANSEQNMTIIQKRRDAEMGGQIKELEAVVADRSKELVKVNAEWAHKKASVEEEEKAKQAAMDSIKETEAAIASKNKSLQKTQSAYDKTAAEHSTKEAAFADAERRCHAIEMGMTESADGTDKTFEEQLKDAKNAEIAANTEFKQCEMRIKHSKDELKKKRPAAKGSEKEYAKMQGQLTKLEAEVKQLQDQIDGMDFSPEKESELKEQKLQLERELGPLRDQVDKLRARLSNLNFSYKTPSKGFDRSAVKGLVAELITVKDSAASTALEVTAGGKLYNVVVDNEVTGKELLTKGGLQRRVTIIPLNKIAQNPLSREKIAAAKREASGQVDVALSIVGYANEVEAAMQYVFGRTLVCETMEDAKKVTFHKDVKTKSVTLDGDVFDPSGTLTGGARAKTQPILTQLQELKEAEQRLNDITDSIKGISAQLSKMKNTAAKYHSAKTSLDLKSHELGLIRERVEQSHHHQVLEELRQLEATLEQSEAALVTSKEKAKQAVQRCKDIEAEKKAFQSQRESRLKAAEKERTSAKAAVSKSKEKMASATQALDETKLEIEALEGEIEVLKKQIEACEANVETLQAEADSMGQDVAAKHEAHKAATEELELKKEKLQAYDLEIQELAKTVAHATKKRDAAELDLKKLEHKVSRLQKEKKDAARLVDAMLAQNEWIAAERKYFGQPGTAFDFAERDPKKAKRRLAELQSAQDKLSKSVNMKVLSMFDKAEKEYGELLKKKNIVSEDKSKIEKAIRELDDKKNEALKKAYEQVNKDFGSIFSTLLPGTNARLSPCEGQSVLDGLQVKVAFGDVWKESLTELSGGQRSLVALSLILSLLLFKPAPLYILDEVDAALDLSHTQNIGQMLRTHFNKSQFIVVSLKDGMFNNANVLFKTKFVDGVSTVRRFAQLAPGTAEDKENASEKTAKGKKSRSGAPRARTNASRV
eukprot:m.381612 g.381612  ORF g.381612 m.381612 type:complete len:1209 (+) comp20043_c0_seq2:233-3859(+)